MIMRSRSFALWVPLFAMGVAACGGDAQSGSDDMVAAGGDGSVHVAGTSLKFSVQPPTAKSGTVITPGVQVSALRDDGTVNAAATDSITIVLSPNPGDATVGGTLTKPAIAGIATFSDLVVDKGGAGYTLTASAAGYTSAVSTPFNVARVLSFATPTPLTTAGSVNSQDFASGRFHAAGYDDFVSSQNGDNNIIVYLSNGSGTFNGGTTYATGAQPIAVATGDIDGDGKVDIVVQCAKEVDVMLGDGAGAFTKFPFPTGNASSNLAGIAVGKFTKSTKLEVVVADTFDNSIYLYSNTSAVGAPSFTLTHVVGPPGLSAAKGIAAGDFNADGATDLAFANFSTGNAAVVWLNANTSVAATTFVLSGASTPPLLSGNAVAQTVTAADFNSDGKSDFFVPDDTPKNAGGIQNQGNVVVATATGFASATETNVGGDPFGSGVADFDRDGIIDIAVASAFGLPFVGGGQSDLEVLLSKGDGTFQTTQTFKTGAGDSSGRSLTIGDYNGDGLPDVIIGSAPSAWVFFNTSK